MELLHRKLTEQIIGIFYDVYNEIGSGLLETVARNAMVIALRSAKLAVRERCSYPVFFRGEIIGEFFPDLVVDDVVLVEIKSKSALVKHDEAQIINYLRVSPLEVALMFNFGPTPQVMRRVLSTERKAHRGTPQPIDSRILER